MDKERVKFYASAILLVLFVVLRIIGPFQQVIDWTDTINSLMNSFIVIAVALLFKEFINLSVKDKLIRRISGYILSLGAVFIVLFVFQEKIVAGLISLGIVAGVLIFVFQAPLLNFIGWIYLRSSRVYNVGDRIRIGNIKGDVIDINPVRTKLQEIGGEYVQADLISGRVYTFPNSVLLSEPTSNYTKYFPYIWVDLFFHLTYETDFAFVMDKIEKVILNHMGDERNVIQKDYMKLKKSFGIKEEKAPLVNFNLVSFQSWIELRVTFPLDPRKQSVVTTEVTQKILQMFNKYPHKVKFPKGRSR